MSLTGPRDDALDHAISKMRAIDDDASYYLVILHKEPNKRITWSVFSKWARWSHRNDSWEVRRASLINGGKFKEMAAGNLEHGVSVRSAGGLVVYLAMGGLALLEPSVAKYWVPGLLEPMECTADRGPGEHQHDGFFAIRDFSSRYTAVDRMATGKLRMQVLKRDDYRCVVCGRRARDNPDIQLHVHHIIPYQAHGPTVESNLATLCGACHIGLGKYDPSIRELAGLPGIVPPLSENYFLDVHLRSNLIKAIAFEAIRVSVDGREIEINEGVFWEQ